MSNWAEEYLTMIEDCEKRESRLTDWERGFLDSLGEQLFAGRRPSTRQIETLDSIWEKAIARG